MDVPPRQALGDGARAARGARAAASVTNVPRSLAAALPPLFTGMMLDRSVVGWPLVCGGLLKGAYDLLLLARFRTVATHGEERRRNLVDGSARRLVGGAHATDAGGQ